MEVQEIWPLTKALSETFLYAPFASLARLSNLLHQVGSVSVRGCEQRGLTELRFQDIVVLVRDTGLRNEKELYQVRTENIHWERHLVFVPDSKTINGIREVPLSDRALAVLSRRCGDRRGGWVFPSKRAESGHLTTIAVKFRQARTKAGLPKNLVLYCGRHDFGTRVLKKTGNLKLVMQTMGQKDVKTAMK